MNSASISNVVSKLEWRKYLSNIRIFWDFVTRIESKIGLKMMKQSLGLKALQVFGGYFICS